MWMILGRTGDTVAKLSKSRVTQLFHSSWEYRDQRSSARLNRLSGEREGDSEDRGVQVGIMSLLFLLTGADVRHGHRSQGVQYEAIGVFPQLLGNSKPQGMIDSE